MNHEHLCKFVGSIRVENFCTGILLAHFLNEETKHIFLKNNLLKYNNQKEFIYIALCVNENNDETIKRIDQKEIVKNEMETIVVENYEQLFASVQEFQFIAVDKNLLPLFEREYNHIKQMEFNKTHEGIVWSYIIKLLELPYESSVFDFVQLEYGYNFHEHNSFEYVQYSYLKDNVLVQKIDALAKECKLQELYALITHCQAQFFKTDELNELKQLLESAIVIKKVIHDTNEKFIITDELLPFFENVAHVGFVESKYAKKNIVFRPKIVQHESWDVYNCYKIEPDSLYEKKMLNLGQIAKFEAIKHFGIRYEENNLFADVKKFVINSIRNQFCKNIKYDNQWQGFLARSGIETMKILKRAQALEANFYEWFNFHKFDKWEFYYKIEDCVVDFIAYKKDEVYVAFFSWNDITQSSIFHTQPKIEKVFNLYASNLSQAVIISCNKVTQIQEPSNNNYIIKQMKTKENDLFYWNFEID